jgi:hypothetical protein
MNQGFNQAASALGTGFDQAAGALGYNQQQQGGYNANPGAMQPMGAYPQGGPMMQQGGGAPAGVPGQHGPKGEVKNGMTILLISIATCGLYQMIWFIQVSGEMSRFLQRDEPNWLKIIGLSMVTCGMYGLYWQLVALGPLVQEIQQRAGVHNPQNHGFMYLIPYYNVFLLQQELNKAWQAPG